MHVIHEVVDFNIGHKAYLEHTANKADSMIGILRNINNPSLLFVGGKTENHQTAKAFTSSDDLENTMEAAGVISTQVKHLMDISHFKTLKYFNNKLRICKHALL
ncbi:hypothetical protein CW736_03090 [Nonlabens sp. MB-3u-79]|jgi:hypothetical protein|uniref:hypothetical protein n=1 Tax=Nonlabens sp. MB-3u-79 TaxID=2058134 RepID=UPI000C31063D|nr:hypothetical protein [Nonlabens sp. MB-3u-79]AUC78447.1 hypothetical protein CW736_03090 [Nonlabens sp. MB-3u-79]|tara:strand:- start:6521 stop:6832 length:312 start_codon:yes stop_codon:yes gene_type:complete